MQTEVVSEWKEYDIEEIKFSAFIASKSTVKRNGSLDFISWFCGIFAVTCMVLVLYFGIFNRMTLTMLILIPIYIIIAVFSFCQPLQVKISEFIWDKSFRKKLAQEKGYESVLKVTDEDVTVCRKSKEKVYKLYSECFFYESKNYITLNIGDDIFFPILKETLKNEEKYEMLRGLSINRYRESFKAKKIIRQILGIDDEELNGESEAAEALSNEPEASEKPEAESDAAGDGTAEDNTTENKASEDNETQNGEEESNAAESDAAENSITENSEAEGDAAENSEAESNAAENGEAESNAAENNGEKQNQQEEINNDNN